ncbi:hypothetical protein [Mailhella massiliensis]|uniref:hypothetical protein n=1 Tax=Mailhella massiliensis TaxID=1903261 RepID=UPI00097D2A6D|nr:hypothetical protein [Mailhella massiliensis]
MNFKDALAFDSEHVFLNLEEFGEEVELDGVKLIAVRGEEENFEASTLYPELPERPIVLHVSTDMLLPEIAMGASVTLNGELCQVVSRHDGLGSMTRLELVRRGY